MTNEEEKERLLSEIPLKQEKHRNDVINVFSNYNVKVILVESLNNSYKLEENKEKHI